MTLELVDIDHRYGRRASLQRVSLTVRPGECFGFVGHNGAGKTTALRIALGLLHPRRGQVRIDGFDAERFPLEARARTGGLIETTGFFTRDTALANLTELARLQGYARRAARTESSRVLEIVGLTDAAERRVGAFSAGMRQRLGIAQALLGEPRYVLLDEPLNALDPEGVADVRRVLEELAARGIGVLLSSHQLSEVEGLCERVGLLREGRMLFEDDLANLVASGANRHELKTDDGVHTASILTELGLEHDRPDTSGHFTVELDGVAPATLVRTLVERGLGVEQLTPRPHTLEDVYLRHARDAAQTDAVATQTSPSRGGERISPAERVAPRGWLWRVSRFELAQSLRLRVALLLAIPSALAWLRIRGVASDHAAHVAAVEAGELFSTSTISAFEGLAHGLIAGLPALALLAAALASPHIAGELEPPTLRNVLLRPVRRFHVAIGKVLTTSAITLAGYVALALTSVAAAAASFDFGDTFEISREGEPELWIAAADIASEVSTALTAPILPLLGYTALGLLAGALLPRALWSLTVTLLVVAALELGRGFFGVEGLEPWLLSEYVPSPFGDASHTRYFLDLAVGNADAYFPHEETQHLVPSLWILIAFGIATVRIQRKQVA